MSSIVENSESPLEINIDTQHIKLHIGGKQIKEGWKILNAQSLPGVDFVGDIRFLDQFPDACCEIVYASHVLEHIGISDIVKTLSGIRRILCSTGKFYVSVPDLDVLSRLFIHPDLNTSQKIHIMRMMFGGQVDEHDFHYIGLNADILLSYLGAAGFSRAKQVDSFGLFSDTSDYKPYGEAISLNMIVEK